MAKTFLPGIGEIETSGKGLSSDEFDALKSAVDYRKSVDNTGFEALTPDILDEKTGYYNLPEIDTKLRFALSGAPNTESVIATLKKYYPVVKADQLDPGNFIVTDKDGKKFIVDNKQKTNLKDVIDFGKDITQAVTSTVGAVKGSALGPIGTIGGAGAGMTLGGEGYERVAQLAGLEIDRTPTEYFTTRAAEFALGSVAQTVAPIAFKGLKYILRGGEIGQAKLVKGLQEFKEVSDIPIPSYLKVQQDALGRFKAVDPQIKPTISAVTENIVFDNIESIVGKFPVGGDILRRGAEKSMDQLGQRIAYLTGEGLNFAKPQTTEAAGLAVKKGILGNTEFGVGNQLGWLGQFKNEAARLYDNVNIPPLQPVQFKKTSEFLQTKIGGTIEIKELTKLLRDPQLERMFASFGKLTTKAEDGSIITNAASYKNAKYLRTLVGEKLASANIIDTTSRGTYKQLYGAISEDIKTTAKNVGPKALKDYETANIYYKTQISKWDNFLETIANKVDLDTLVPQLLTKAKAGSTTLREVVGSLKPNQVRVLVSAAVDKLGKAKPTGVPGIVERTNTFNTQQFLSNWLSLDDVAKNVLFNKTKDLQSLRNSLDKIANVATRFERANPFENLGETAKRTFAGTGLLLGAAGSIGAGVATGSVGTGLTFLATVPVFGAGTAYAYKALSNPKFMEWIAKSTTIAENKGFEGWSKHLTGLGIIAANSDGDIRMLTEQNLKILEQAGKNISKNQAQTQQAQPQPQSISKPVNTRVTDVQTRPMAAPMAAPMQGTMPAGGLRERISQSNQLDQFIPVR